MENTSVNRAAYAGKQGERYDVVRPKDSNVLRGDGSFIAESVHAAEFGEKRADRFDARRPEPSDLWKVYI